MSEKWVSNLKNQPQCEARSKRTGKPCRQPKMTGKRVCRFHGGKSTGPKTREGKERIRQARLVHGRYSKNSEERRIAIQDRKDFRNLLQLSNKAAKNQLRQIDAIAPYWEAYRAVESQEEFELVNLFVFGRLNLLLKRNPTLREMMREMFNLLYRSEGYDVFESFLELSDRRMARFLDIDDITYSKLNPDERSNAYLTQFCSRLIDIRDTINHLSPRRPPF